MNRLILRTVAGKPVRRPPPRPRPVPLTLRPVVYGAADHADELGLPWETPTRKVQDALIASAGPGQFTRVRSWRAWRSAVNRVTPELLVVVADTEMRNGAPNLVIGQRSRLRPRAVSVRKSTVNSPAPVVLLCGCGSDTTGEVLDAFPGAFIENGAAAVVATLTNVGAVAAAQAATAVVNAMHSSRPAGPTLAAALTEARQLLIANGSPVGLLLVAYGELDIPLNK